MKLLSVFFLLVAFSASAGSKNWSSDLATFKKQVADAESNIVLLNSALAFASTAAKENPDWDVYLNNELYPYVMKILHAPATQRRLPPVSAYEHGEAPETLPQPPPRNDSGSLRATKNFSWSDRPKLFATQIIGNFSLQDLEDALAHAESKMRKAQLAECTLWLDWNALIYDLAVRVAESKRKQRLSISENFWPEVQ
jgi:hypothetical protein